MKPKKSMRIKIIVMISFVLYYLLAIKDCSNAGILLEPDSKTVESSEQAQDKMFPARSTI